GCEILINGYVDLEEHIGSIYPLLAEPRSLRGMSCFRTTIHTHVGPCSSIFAGKRVERSMIWAPGGRLTDRPMFTIRLPSTRTSAGPVSSSDEPSNIRPHTSAVAVTF